MKVSAFLVVVALAAGILAAAQAPAQQPPPAPTPAAGQAPVPPLAGQAPPPPAVPASRRFTSDAGIMISAIKPDKTADFEQIMADVRGALMKSEKPERKQQAAGWKVVKSATPMKDGNVVYMHLITPVVKGADYTILAILYEANPDPTAQRAIFEKYRDAFAASLGGGAFTTVLDLSKP